MSASPGRVIVPLDVPTLAEATALATRLAGTWPPSRSETAVHCGGPAAIRTMHDLGLRVFLDLKYTTFEYCRGAVAARNPWACGC